MDLPDLTFAGEYFGEKQIPWDLRRWLYKGGAGTRVDKVFQMIDAGELGRPLNDRVELVSKIHEVLSNSLDRGARRATVQGDISTFSLFFQWADEVGRTFRISTVDEIYRQWADSLLQRARIRRDISGETAYHYGRAVGFVLDKILERSRPILTTTGLHRPKPKGARAVSRQSDKQNLEETFAFGHFLLDISDALPVNAIWGELPVRIALRNGGELIEWPVLQGPSIAPPGKVNKARELRAKNRAKLLAERSRRTRFPLINLRIQVEMFMLMGQPAVNLAQTHTLRMDQWRFKASTNGYEIRTYKHRRWGPVVFEIYSSYRQVFERYLAWRAAIFPDDPDGLLFPLLGPFGAQTSRHHETAPCFGLLKARCARAGIKYLPPSQLRNTNVNWMLRRTQDPELTAGEKQHAVQTLLGVYEKPSQQRAMVQIKGFWAKHDPAQLAAGPGSCTGNGPRPMPDIPANASKPDCLTPAGCLFCVNLRDIDSLDHIWSLASYRLLKSFELKGPKRPDSNQISAQHPAEIAIERLTAKLNFIRGSNKRRSEWVEEALLRLEEGRYHPAWAAMIESF